MAQRNMRYLSQKQAKAAYYFMDFQNIRKLTSEEKKELLKRVKQGDKEARNLLVNANLRLVVFVASQFMNYNYDFDDLIQEGNIGLMKAVEKFDIEKGYQFSTYAVWWIWTYMQKWVHSQIQPASFSYDALEKLNKLKLQYDQLMVSLGRTPTKEELAQQTNISMGRLEQLYKYLDAPTVSLNYTDTEDKEPLIESLEDLSALEEFDEYIEQQDLASFLETIYETMPERWAQVLREYYPMDGSLPKSLKDIGKEIGITREAVRQMKEKGLRKLRETEALKEYLSH